MTQNFTTTSSQSLFSRLGSSIKGILFGVIVFVIGFPVLWKNEGNAVKNTDALKELTDVTVRVGTPEIKPENEGKPVYMTGMAETTEKLHDSIFGIQEVAIKLSRSAEIYQWIEEESSETRKKLGGGTETVTTYSYKQEWVGKPVDSNQFTIPEARTAYQNVGSIAFPDETKKTSNLTFGDFSLTEQVDRIGGSADYKFSENFQLPDSLKALGARIEGQYVIVPFQKKPSVATAVVNAVVAQTTPAAQQAAAATTTAAQTASTAQQAAAATTTAVQTIPAAQQAAATATTAAQTASTAQQAAAESVATAVTQAVIPQTAESLPPQIGDTRYTFSIIRPHDISIIAVQQNGKFASYVAKNGKQQFLLYDGTRSIEEMFAAKASSNKMSKWFFRLLGFFLMFIGLNMIFKPLVVLGEIVPFIGKIIGIGTGIISFFLALICSLVTVAIAWIAYRPVLGVSLLVIAGVCIYLLFSRKKAVATV